jgi:hypothetical protein
VGPIIRLLEALFERGQMLGCRSAWVLTEAMKAPARRLYAAAVGQRSSEQMIMFEFRLASNS